MHDPAAEVQPPLHPSAERFDPVIRAVQEPDRFEDLPHSLREPPAPQSVGLPPEAQVLLRREILVERDFLWHDAHPRLGGPGLAGHLVALHPDPATGR